jgi:membrane protein DedA with SNARE-associated domain
VNRVLENRLLSRLVNTSHMDRVERYFRTHGGKTVLIGRSTPGMRGPTPLFAGVSRMSYPRFLAFNATAIAVWATAYSLADYAFGEYWDELLLAARSFRFVVLGLAAAAFGAYLLYQHRKASGERTNHGFAAAKDTKNGSSTERNMQLGELLILTVILTALVMAVYASFAP